MFYLCAQLSIRIGGVVSMKKRILVLLMTLFGAISAGWAQDIAVKTNLFYGAYAATPNLGLEFGLGKRSTLDLGAGYNWFTPNKVSNKKLVHWLAQAEYRYWFCQKFNGHFVGAHALGTQYNISGKDLKWVFGRDAKEHRYEGWGIGVGISYGYQFYLGRRWSLETTVGVGYVRLNYDRYKCPRCGELQGREHRNYFGPTKAGISLIYIIK